MKFLRFSVPALFVVALSAHTDEPRDALFAAIQGGNTGEVATLVDGRAGANVVDAGGMPALMAATLFGDAAIETGHGCSSLVFAARDDSELYGLLDRIQDLGLHLIILYEVGGTEAVPHLPSRASLAHPGASPLELLTE